MPDYQGGGGMVLKRRTIIILGSAFLIGQRRMRVFWVLERAVPTRRFFEYSQHMLINSIKFTL